MIDIIPIKAQSLKYGVGEGLYTMARCEDVCSRLSSNWRKHPFPDKTA